MRLLEKNKMHKSSIDIFEYQEILIFRFQQLDAIFFRIDIYNFSEILVIININNYKFNQGLRK